MMKAGNKSIGNLFRKTLSAVLCAAMLADPLSALVSFAAEQTQEIMETEAEIDGLLSAGNYVEGQAIVVMKNDGAQQEEDLLGLSEEDWFTGSSELLMNVDSANIEAVDGELLSSSFGEQSEEDLSIVFVEQEELSTRALLRKLMKDPRVVSAEPNYIIVHAEGDDDGDDDLLGEEEKATPSIFWNEEQKSKDYTFAGYDQGESKIDLTNLEWAMNRAEGDKSFTMFDIDAAKGTSDLNLEGWNDASKKNAGCTVVILDDGVDYNHPDLKNVMADLTPYIEPLRELGFNSGARGLNVADEGKEDDPMPYQYEKKDGGLTGSHGTHVAGLVASEWNEFGTSGVANGVKLIAIKYYGKSGGGNLAAQLKAYNYIYQLAKLDQGELNIRIINESFGTDPGVEFSTADILAVEQLGKEGILVVKAAGNESTDIGTEHFSTVSVKRSQTALLVGAANVGGKPDPGYTNYGMNVDLFAQGTDALSTIPLDQTYSNGQYFAEVFRNFTDYKDNQVFFETFYNDTETFDDKGVIAVDLYDDGWKLKKGSGSYTDQYVFDTKQYSEKEESGALQIDLTKYKVNDNEIRIRLGMKLGSEPVHKLKEEKKGEETVYRIDPTDESYTKYAELKEKVKFAGLKLGTGKTDKASFSVFPMMFIDGGSCNNVSDYEITGYSDSRIKIGLTQNSTGNYTVNLDKGKEYAAAYGIPYISPVSAEIRYEDDTPVEVNYYLYLQIDITGNEQLVPGSEELPYMYIDAIGIGNKLLPYAYWNGTSMATPVASGMAAVMYERLSTNESFNKLSKRAQVIALMQELKATTVQNDSTKENCRSGLLNSTVSETRIPVLENVSTESDGSSSIRLEGVYFGNYDSQNCKVTVSGYTKESGKRRDTELIVKSWKAGEGFSNGVILCEKPSDMESGVYYVTVTSCSGYGSMPALLKFEDAPLFETEIRMPAAFDLSDPKKTSQEKDVANFADTIMMAASGNKLYLIPDNEYVTELWEYDPLKGTEETAFARVTEPLRIPQMFNLPEGQENVIYGMAGSCGNLWFYGAGYDTEKKKQTSLIVKLDLENRANPLWYPVNEEYENDKSEMVALGENGSWLAFLSYGSSKTPKKDDNGNGINDSINFRLFNTETGITLPWDPQPLPAGLTVKKDTVLHYAAGEQYVYIAGEFVENGKTVQKLLAYKVTLTQKQDGSWEGTFGYSSELPMPQFNTSEKSLYTLTMKGNTPILTAAHVTNGDDCGYDTFIYDGDDGSYARYKKNFSLEKVYGAKAAVLNGTLYVTGASVYSTSQSVMMMRATSFEKKQESYTVHFDNQGHGTKPASVKVKAGELIPAPGLMQAEGYLFAGWYKEASCDTYWDFEEDKMPAHDMTLYAYWIPMEEDKYTVVFNNQGHGTQPASVQVKAGELIPAPAVMKEQGYLFAGWYKEASCDTYWDFETDRMPAKDMTLYAYWIPMEEDKYTVVFNNQGHGTQPASVQVKAGELIPAPRAMEEQGYLFAGWYKEASCDTYWDFEKDKMPAQDMTLYAYWIPEEEDRYTVVFDHQGHGTQPASVQKKAGELIPEPEALTEEGYTFGGWYREASCKTKWNFKTDKMPAQDMKLYAGWTKIYVPVPTPSTGGQEDSSPKAPQPKAAVTPIVKQANGTQTMGSSIISLPAAKLSAADKAQIVEGSWKKSTQGYWQFAAKDGTKLVSRWALVPDSLSSASIGNYSWFYFDEKGNMATGWQWVKGADGKSRCYYLNEEAGSLYGACLMGGTVQNWQLDEKGAWKENGAVVTR